MAAIRSVSVRKTWKEYADAVLTFFIPPIKTNPNSVIIVMDTYGENQIKEMTQSSRGQEGKRIQITGENLFNIIG